jgi:hypothetical protein
MKDKVFLMIAALIFCGFYANSQTTGITFGLRGGIDFQNINGKDLNGDKLKLNLVPCFNLGLVVEIPIANDFYFQPGLLFATKGAKSKDEFLGLDMSVEYNIAYIEAPLSLLYKPVIGNGRSFLGFGPYLAYGVGGKAKFVIGNSTTEEKIKFTNEYESLNPYDWKYFKPLDFGGNLFFGYELKNGISLQLNTQLGLAKINAKNKTLTSNKSEFRNTGYGFTLGYIF